jgi:hypothetical protein
LELIKVGPSHCRSAGPQMFPAGGGGLYRRPGLIRRDGNEFGRQLRQWAVAIWNLAASFSGEYTMWHNIAQTLQLIPGPPKKLIPCFGSVLRAEILEKHFLINGEPRETGVLSRLNVTDRSQISGKLFAQLLLLDRVIDFQTMADSQMQCFEK